MRSCDGVPVVEGPVPLLVRQVELPTTPAAPRLGRGASDAVVERVDDEGFGFAVRLAASELVSNAVLHGPEETILLGVALFDEWATGGRGRRADWPENLRHARRFD
jgi:hypothetical protein